MEVSQTGTHGVENQAPPLTPYNVFEADLPLREALEREGGDWGVDRVRDIGELAGSAEAIEHGRRAERNEPVLRTHDRYGNRIDAGRARPVVALVLRQAVEREIHVAAVARTRSRAPTSCARRCSFVWAQVESGVMCPISMTYAAVPALREEPELAAEWEPRMTRPTTTRGALRHGDDREAGRLRRARQHHAAPSERRRPTRSPATSGSAPIRPCDVFLIARTGARRPVVLPDRGRDPGIEIQRLKDKLGTRSLPSCEVEFRGVRGQLVGEEGRGVPTIIEMVNHTRLDCLLGSSTGMRRGVARRSGTPGTAPRSASCSSTSPRCRTCSPTWRSSPRPRPPRRCACARAYDEDDHAFKRIATAVLKYWVCKRAPGHAAEALECLGGNGYVEESGMPRLYRDAPLNSIWEGSGNVAALDVLRAFAKEPEALPAFLAECELGRGANPHSTRTSTGIAAHAARGPRVRGAPRGRRTWGWRSRRACWCATRRPRSPTRSAPRASRRRRPLLRHAAAAGRRRGDHRPRAARLNTLRYEVTGRVARITLDRPERGNGITLEMPRELARVRRAGEPRSRRPRDRAGRQRARASAAATTWCEYAEHAARRTTTRSQPWDPMVDYQMMSRNVRGFMSLFHSDKPVVCKVHGFCVAGGTDMALCSDLLVIADDARIGYPPARVWGVPTTALWAHRIGDQRAKRLLFTGDLIDGAPALEWGLAIEAPPAARARRALRGAGRARSRSCRSTSS